MQIRRKSYHSEDGHLYMVAAKKLMAHLPYGLHGMKQCCHSIMGITV
ncbi:MAG: hypothetical protein K2K70_00215 [Lachnospiraceae bacterium]|nr:hypothetical protein [Lachnospiraceae bacterium]